MTWRAAPPTNETQAADPTFERARVVLRDGVRIALRDVTVRADSVVGFAGSDRTRVAVARSEVAQVESRGVSVGRTLAVLGGVVAIVAIAALAAVASALGDFTAAPSPSPVLP
jgi:hypothetical protein